MVKQWPALKSNVVSFLRRAFRFAELFAPSGCITRPAGGDAPSPATDTRRHSVSSWIPRGRHSKHLGVQVRFRLICKWNRFPFQSCPAAHWLRGRWTPYLPPIALSLRPIQRRSCSTCFLGLDLVRFYFQQTRVEVRALLSITEWRPVLSTPTDAESAVMPLPEEENRIGFGLTCTIFWKIIYFFRISVLNYKLRVIKLCLSNWYQMR